MERQQAVDFLNQQLEKLKNEEHVADLMKARRSKELEKIASELDFSLIDKFLKKTDLDLSKEEILEGFCYEMAFYMYASKWPDCEFFENDTEFQYILYKMNEDLATQIADTMDEIDLHDCTIEELLNGLEKETEE